MYIPDYYYGKDWRIHFCIKYWFICKNTTVLVIKTTLKKTEWFSSSRNSLQRRITINLSNRTSCTFAIFFYSMAWMGHHTINVWFWEVMDSWSSTDAWSIGHCTCYKPYDRKSYFIIKILQSSKWIQDWKFYFVLPRYQRRSIWPLNRDDNLRWLYTPTLDFRLPLFTLVIFFKCIEYKYIKYKCVQKITIIFCIAIKFLYVENMEGKREQMKFAHVKVIYTVCVSKIIFFFTICKAQIT